MCSKLQRPLIQQNLSATTTEEQHNWLSCGNIILNKDKWLLLFNCDLCHRQFETFAQILKHYLQYHVQPEDDEILKQLLAAHTGSDEEVDAADADEVDPLTETFKEEQELIEDGALIDGLEDTDDDVISIDKDSAVEEQPNSCSNKGATDEQSNAAAVEAERILDNTADTSQEEEKEQQQQEQQQQQQCAHCKKAMSSNNSNYCNDCVLNKVAKRRKANNTFDCKICGKQVHKSNYKTHLRRHTGQRSQLCPICGRGFVIAADLNKHIKTTHSEVKAKPFACTQCNAQYPKNYLLKNHMRRHIDDRPFPCEFCTKRFFTQSLLNGHLKTHTDERRYECTICDMKFKLSKGLTEHLKVHANIKSYKCQYCDAAFVQSAGLAGHRRRRHPEMYEKK